MTINFVDPADWALILANKPNVLLCGDRAFTDAVLTLLLPHCRLPIQKLPKHFGRPASLVSPTGTVLLHNIDTYNTDEQQALVAWLEDMEGLVQLISTTDNPVIDLVERGEFLDELFYSLNTVYLDLGCESGRMGSVN